MLPRDGRVPAELGFKVRAQTRSAPSGSRAIILGKLSLSFFPIQRENKGYSMASGTCTHSHTHRPMGYYHHPDDGINNEHLQLLTYFRTTEKCTGGFFQMILCSMIHPSAHQSFLLANSQTDVVIRKITVPTPLTLAMNHMLTSPMA